MTIFVCVNTAEAQDTAGRCRQSRLPAFNAGAMNKEKSGIVCRTMNAVKTR